LPGMIALIGFLSALFLVWNRARRRLRSLGNPPGEMLLFRTAGTMLVFLLVVAQFSGDLISNDWLWLWAGVLLAWAPPLSSS
jgi:hypothetical protein